MIHFQEISLANAKRLLCNPGNCWLAAIVLLAAELVLNTVMTHELSDTISNGHWHHECVAAAPCAELMYPGGDTEGEIHRD